MSITYGKAATTADATPTNIHLLPFTDNACALVFVESQFRKADLSTTGGSSVMYKIKKVSGTLTISSAIYDQGDAGTCALISNSNILTVQVTGIAATTLTWTVSVRVEYA